MKRALGPLLLALCWGWPAAAPAQEPRLQAALEVAGSEGGCPAAADVASKLARLLPGVAVTAIAAGGSETAEAAAGDTRVRVEGYSGEEIAALEGIPVATVWTRLHHARRDFLSLLARHGESEGAP